MAVEDKYINADVAAGKLANAAQIQVGDMVGFVTTFEIAAADSIASVYRLMQINPNLIPVKIDIMTDALTGNTDYDLGLYEPGVAGVVVDKDIFADGMTLAVASTKDGMVTVNIANRTKKVWEHAAHTIKTKLPGYDLALTANVVGTTAGTITVVAWFLQG